MHLAPIPRIIYSFPMPAPSADHDDDVVYFRIPLDAETVARLMEVADISHADPVSVAASLLHDILAEDEDAHIEGAADRVTFN